MKQLLLILLCLLTLTSCGASSGEKQIFPICMSIDRTEDGGLRLGVQVSSLSADSADAYTVFFADGDDFAQALEIMGASMPYPLHFGQLRLLMISREIAETEQLSQLLWQVYGLHTIRPHAAVMVALEDAGETMKAQKPDLSVRLSTYLDQLLVRLRQERLTPAETLTDVMRLIGSGYGDPLLGVCAVHPDMKQQGNEKPATPPSAEGGGQPAFAAPQGVIAIGEPSPGNELPEDTIAGKLPREGGNPVEYVGCAAISKDHVTACFTAEQTRLLLLLRENAQVHHVTKQGASVTIKEKEDLSLQPVKEILSLLRANRCDALGIGAAATKAFLTQKDFQQYANTVNFADLPLTITQ